MNRLFAFAWLVIIGSNGAHYYSEEAPYQGAIILAGAAYFTFIYKTELLRLLFFNDYRLVLLMLVVPFLLLLLSERSFDRGVYTSQISIVLVFIVASVLASRADLEPACGLAAFVIVAVGTALNLYELFIENNVWSIAPGRSAGFYVNPNISSQALLGFGLAFLMTHVGKLTLSDLIVMALVIVGGFATFSRAGIIGGLVLITTAVLMRVRHDYIMRVVGGVVGLSLLAFWFASHIVGNLDLSKDAAVRVESLLEAGGLGDYESDRGAAASAALDLINEDPVFGSGVQTSNKMVPEGPHNMFLAMMVDYGIFGLIAYLVIIIRLLLIARRAGRDFSGTILLFVAWLVLFSFASHTMLGNTATVPLMGFALARAYQIQYLASRGELSDDATWRRSRWQPSEQGRNAIS